MAQENVDFVQSLYDAFGQGDIETVLAACDPNVKWHEADNFIYNQGEPFIGPDAVLNGVFVRIVEEWDGFSAIPGEVLDAGDKVVSIGRYGGTYKATGQSVDAQFVHVFTLSDGKVVKFQQFTDTFQFKRAVGS